ncbi:MAG: SDR family oxidoreductase, partial [Rothia mucilaginosa]
AIFRYRAVDVTSEESVTALANAVAALDEPITGAVLAAGIAHSQPLLETSFATWKRLHAVNSDGVFLCLREFARIMIDQQETDPTNSRSLVTVASNAARVPRAEFGAYGASKASAARVSSSFGLQLAAHGIRVNSVCPGTTRTPMVTDAWEGEDRSALPVAGNPETFRLGIPLRRIADPADIAAVNAFLISEAARHITMQEIVADGGATL